MHTGRSKPTKQTIVVCTNTGYHTKLGEVFVRVFEEGAGYGFCSLKVLRIQGFMILVVHITQTRSELVVGVVDDGLINKVGIKVLLLGIVSSGAKVAILFVIEA